MASKDNQMFPIKITNFINPHFFHFKLESIVGQFDTDTEAQLKENAEKCTQKDKAGYMPEIDEIVAAYIVPWKKWCRAQIDLVLQEGKTHKYVVWCLDQGVPMKVESDNLLPMSKSLQSLPAAVYTGGLAKCEPVEMRLNFATMAYESFGISDFPEYLITKAKQLIEEAAEIFFMPSERIGDHVFGDLRITKYCGKKIDLLYELAKTENIKIGTFPIPRDIGEKFTIKKRRYENHLGHLNIQSSMKLATELGNCATISAVSLPSTKNLENDEKIILNWTRQNNELAKQEEHNMKIGFDNVLCALNEHKVRGIATIPYPRSYIYGSSTTIYNSVSHLSSQFGSHSTIAEDNPVDEPALVMGSDPQIHKMERLTSKLGATSIKAKNTNVKPKKEQKKVVYIPSGHESDLVNFHKYNF
ncbi:uncharacterized protein LOC116342844 [Contarinia nasturtii]|uniref:uncharacterized protein LOC116342844 n=1 Tax=Contarinia nasturtii TaxID=265458 RepID=UPI0012D3E2B0|nr:uncharacterized protein LOC116342844 [Contarinia nasturtii]XP_031626486.1 uncharacterized protein LOC116342844 [Contarinia nasturtii]